jgi:hypothetical protein
VAGVHSWTFHSLAMERFLHYFGRSTPEEAEQMIAAATWEEKDRGAKVDMEAIRRILGRVATGGLSYTGLSEPEAEILDQRLKVLFSPWGFEEQLDLEHESPEPYSHIVEVEDRVPEGAEVRFLPMLRFGWRYGTTHLEAEPEYFIFHPDHVEKLAEEINLVMTNPTPWSDPVIAEIVDQNLIKVLASVLEKKKGLAGVWSC